MLNHKKHGLPLLMLEVVLALIVLYILFIGKIALLPFC
jgi:hypothetical protein